MTKIAVTGASGFLGSSLCADLAKDHDVVRIDIRGVEKPVDVTSLDAFAQAVAGCDTIVHLARAGAGQNVGWQDTQINLACTYNAYEAARLGGCKRVIFASSNHAVGYYEILEAPELYQPKNGRLLDTNVPVRPSGLYGVWKCFGEVLGRYYSDEYGLQVACLRIGMAQIPANLTRVAPWLNLTDEQKMQRIASMYLSHADLARCVRAIVASDVPYGIVYVTSDNASRFYDLETGRALYGFWPEDGVKVDARDLELGTLTNM